MAFFILVESVKWSGRPATGLRSLAMSSIEAGMRMGALSRGSLRPPEYWPKRLSSAMSERRSSVPVFMPRRMGPYIMATYCGTLGMRLMEACIGMEMWSLSPFFHLRLMQTNPSCS